MTSDSITINIKLTQLLAKDLSVLSLYIMFVVHNCISSLACITYDSAWSWSLESCNGQVRIMSCIVCLYLGNIYIYIYIYIYILNNTGKLSKSWSISRNAAFENVHRTSLREHFLYVSYICSLLKYLIHNAYCLLTSFNVTIHTHFHWTIVHLPYICFLVNFWFHTRHHTCFFLHTYFSYI